MKYCDYSVLHPELCIQKLYKLGQGCEEHLVSDASQVFEECSGREGSLLVG